MKIELNDRKERCTYDFDEFGDEDAILQVFGHVADEVQPRPLPQLTVDPRRISLMDNKLNSIQFIRVD